MRILAIHYSRIVCAGFAVFATVQTVWGETETNQFSTHYRYACEAGQIGVM
jgi:hypothetical protein